MARQCPQKEKKENRILSALGRDQVIIVHLKCKEIKVAQEPHTRGKCKNFGAAGTSYSVFEWSRSECRVYSIRPDFHVTILTILLIIIVSIVVIINVFEFTTPKGP